MSEYYYDDNFELQDPRKGLGNSRDPQTTLIATL